MERFIDLDGTVWKYRSRRNGPELLAYWARMDKACDVFAHSVPVLLCQFELPEGGVYAAMTKNVIMGGLYDVEVLRGNNFDWGFNTIRLELGHMSSDAA